jgi:hypothetical protein
MPRGNYEFYFNCRTELNLAEVDITLKQLKHNIIIKGIG